MNLFAYIFGGILSCALAMVVISIIFMAVTDTLKIAINKKYMAAQDKHMGMLKLGITCFNLYKPDFNYLHVLSTTTDLTNRKEVKKYEKAVNELQEKIIKNVEFATFPNKIRENITCS